MLKNNLDKLKCPDCGADMCCENNSLLCRGARKHSFDISSEGYINLVHTTGNGDSKEAVHARRTFLDTGYYSPLRDELRNILNRYSVHSGLIADMGCGDGFYSVQFANEDRLSVFGCDLSKFAVKIAAKRAKVLQVSDKTLYTVASVFNTPLKDNSCAAVINLFAPCAEEEYTRILENNGLLIVVGAGINHLFELKELVYASARYNDERKDLPKQLELLEKKTISYKFTPSLDERFCLFQMTPYYYKTSQSDIHKLKTAPITDISAEFDIYVYQKHFKG